MKYVIATIATLALATPAQAFSVPADHFAGISSTLEWKGLRSAPVLSLTEAKRVASRFRSRDGLNGERTATICRRLRTNRALCVYRVETADQLCSNSITVTKRTRTSRATATNRLSCGER